MAYTKVNFTDGTTPLDATNLGKLDDALSDQDSRIDTNNIFIRGTEIPDGADMNNYTTCGNYYINDSSASGNTITNFPESINGGGKVLVIPTEMVNRPMQIFFAKAVSLYGIAFRSMSASSNWTSWRSITTTTIT